MAGRVQLHLTNFRRLPGKAQRYKHQKTGEEISYREFRRRAERRVVEPKPPTPRLTVARKRAKWYANKWNRETFLRQYETGNWDSSDFISYNDAMMKDDFIKYTDLIHSSDPDDRALGWEFFDDLSDYYEEHSDDWGETP